jgi:hypothetical protein
MFTGLPRRSDEATAVELLLKTAASPELVSALHEIPIDHAVSEIEDKLLLYCFPSSSNSSNLELLLLLLLLLLSFTCRFLPEELLLLLLRRQHC